MVNYANGKIYKIKPVNGEDGDIYIGSTTKEFLSQRMVAHRKYYKEWKNNKRTKIYSYDLFDKYGVENCTIILLEYVNALSKDELYSREAYYIRLLKCVNKYIPGRTDKQYREDNKDKIKEKSKVYREINKDKLKEYREINKDKLNEKPK